MSKITRYVGLDVHAQSIAIAVCEGRKVARSVGTVANRPQAVRRALSKLGKPETLRVCYEAGPTGYVLYWQLTKLGIACEVVAPSLVPKKPGERVKTDRRDACKLAQSYRSGELTSVWVPDAAHEALRDLVRAREVAKKDETRAKHRLTKYLLRYGCRPPTGSKAWTHAWWSWLKTVKLPHAHQDVALLDYQLEVEHGRQRVARLDAHLNEAIEEAPERLRAVVEALQSLRGVATLTAVTLAVELGTFARFDKASQVMSYTGLVPSERSSGARRRQGAITRTGNAHLRRVLVEAAWHYRHKPRLSVRQQRLQLRLDPRITQVAWKAQLRLHRQYWKMSMHNKPSSKVAAAVARELVGFAWAVGCKAEELYAHSH